MILVIECFYRYQCEHENNEEFKTVLENNEHAISPSICIPLQKTIENMSLETLSSTTNGEILIMITDKEVPKLVDKSDKNNIYEPNENTVTKFNETNTEEENLKAMNIIKKNPKMKTMKKQKLSLQTRLPKYLQKLCRISPSRLNIPKCW